MKRLITIILLVIALLFILITFWKHSGNSASDSAATVADSAQQQDSLTTFWKYYRKATAERHAGQIKDALQNYQKALKLNPQHDNTLYYMGNTAMMNGNFRLADSCWAVLIRVNPESARAFNQLGGLYFCPAAGDFWNPEKARKYFLKASALNQVSPGTQNRLGEIALIQGKEQKAYDFFNQTVVSSPNSVQAQFLLSYIDWRHNRISAARSHFIATLHSLPYSVFSKHKKNVSNHDECAYIENRINNLIPEFTARDTTVWMDHVFSSFSINPGNITRTSTR